MHFARMFERFALLFFIFCLLISLKLWTRVKQNNRNGEITDLIKMKETWIGTANDCKCPRRVSNKSKFPVLKSIYPELDPFGSMNITQTIQNRHPNIGSNLLDPRLARCSFIPFFTKLNWDGVWQTTEPFFTEDQRIVKWNLYSASCDRKDGIHCDLVRILSLSTKSKPPNPYCYFWENMNSNPIVVKAKHLVYYGMGNERNSKKLQTYMIVCEPKESLMISAVSISYNPCGVVTNYLQINEGETRKADLAKQALQSNTTQSPAVGEYDVAACLIALYYYSEDLSVKLVEWLELLKAMKVSKVLTYVYDIHPNNMKVLAHYEKMGFISITYFNNPSPYLNTPIVRRFWSQADLDTYRQVARIHRSDCILRNRHQYNYIYHLDRDEIPSMKKHKYLPNLIRDISLKFSYKHVSFGLKWQNIYINVNPGESSNSTPNYLHMLKHNLYSKICFVRTHCSNQKTIHDTRDVILIGAHTAKKCYSGKCKVHHVHEKTATTAHFRRFFEGNKKLLIEDNTLFKYSQAVVGRIDKTLSILKIN